MWQNDHERATRASRRSPRRQGLFRIYTAVAVVTGSLGFLRAAHSSTLTWDASGANPTDPADGTGTWDTSPDADWSDGSTDFVWNADTTGSTDTAVFGNNNGAAGTVTLSAPLSTGSISFLSPGTGSYIVGNSTSQLTISTGDVSVAPNVSATITSPIAGSNGLTVSGGGTLHLGGLGTTSPVAYTGNTTVNDSTLQFNNLSTSTAITLGSGSTSNVLLTGANAALTSAISQSKQFYINSNVSIDDGTNATVNFSQRTYFGESSTVGLSGGPTSTLTINFGTISTVNRDLFYAAASNFLGTLNIQPANSSGGQLVFETVNGAFSSSTTGGFSGTPGTLSLNGAISTANPSAGSPLTIGALLGASTGLIETPVSGGTATWSIGGLGLSTTYAGTIVGANAVTLTGGTLSLTGANTYAGNTSVTGGTLIVGNTGSISSPNINVAAGAAIIINGSLSSSSPLPTVNANGTSASGSAVTFGANTTTGILPRTLAALNIGSNSVVTIANAPLTPGVNANRTVLVTPVLSFADTTGTLDLGSNDLIVQSGANGESVFGTISGQVAAGRGANGSWTNTGITSSAAAAASSANNTALAVVVNDTNQTPNGSLSGTPLFNTFDNQTVNDGDVLVKYTYYGDALLTGSVTAADYLQIDNAFSFNANPANAGNLLTGWYNGDFNYDGVINGDDYTLIDNAFNSQGSVSFAGVPSGPAELIAANTSQIADPSTVAVPEPLTPGLITLAALCYPRRRRRKPA